MPASRASPRAVVVASRRLALARTFPRASSRRRARPRASRAVVARRRAAAVAVAACRWRVRGIPAARADSSPSPRRGSPSIRDRALAVRSRSRASFARARASRWASLRARRRRAMGLTWRRAVASSRGRERVARDKLKIRSFPHSARVVAHVGARASRARARGVRARVAIRRARRKKGAFGHSETG